MNKINVENRTLGINFSSRGAAEALVWAPFAEEVTIRLADQNERIPLEKQKHGYHSVITSKLVPGDKYFLEFNQRERYPDPASIYQPDGVSGPSMVCNLNTHRWSDKEWKNIPLKDYIFYELHVGTFTPDGTFEGLIERLGYLSKLGVTAIELMPVAEFSGKRNWGYDGVFPFAVHHTYGGPSGLQRLVDECHAYGIAVVLDVVYNHLGPEGNYLDKYGPYFTEKYKTPWGKAINFDDAGSDEVRRYFIENVLMWLRDFHIDALRLDAVHAIKDFGARHLLQEIRENVDKLSVMTGRDYHLIAECDLNDPKYIKPIQQGGYGMSGQWIDEFHHALRVSSGNESIGYYSDFNGLFHLAKSFRDGYVYDGQYSPHREKSFGAKATGIPSSQFVVFSQNHDQVGNRMLGERTTTLVSFEMTKLMAATVITSPFLPMLFMGEEYGETNPFQYFVNHSDEALISAVRNGRKEEFKAFHNGEEVPDPQSEETFVRSRLQWELLEQEKHQTMLKFYQELISIRKTFKALTDAVREDSEIVVFEDSEVIAFRRVSAADEVVCFYNFSKYAQQVESPYELGKATLRFNSSDKIWMGSAVDNASDKSKVLLSPESFKLFTNSDV